MPPTWMSPQDVLNPYLVQANKPMDPFSYTPQEDDPELELLRARGQRIGQQRRRSNINELARSGLLGSSVGLDYTGELERDIGQGLEDIDESVFSRRRDEARRSYEAEQAFRRQVALTRLQAQLQKDMQGNDLTGLGNLLALGIGMIPGGGPLAAISDPIGGSFSAGIPLPLP